MTREVAIKAIQDFIGWFKEDSLIRKALDMAIQALEQNESTEEWYKLFVKKLDEQEPCNDAISREAAINIASLHCLTIDETVKAIEQLPSVTQKSGNPQSSEHFIDGVHAMGYREGYKDAQKQKSGKWIDYSDEGYVECPFCGHATNCEDNIDELHYCFYCGAKMESEDKE